MPLSTLDEVRMYGERFRKKMGGPKDVILGWGGRSNETMRFHEPTKGRGMRSLFKRAGYQLFLVNEYNTSCRCYGCSGGACVKFKEVENPRFWKRKERPKVLCHGLLRCATCKRLWNRDRNGSLNIMRCAKNALEGKTRDDYLDRKKISGAMASLARTTV